jgi:hypothetical protein
MHYALCGTGLPCHAVPTGMTVGRLGATRRVAVRRESKWRRTIEDNSTDVLWWAHPNAKPWSACMQNGLISCVVSSRIIEFSASTQPGSYFLTR